ncbi:Flp family type IVb pilin [Rhizorhapis sp. SPR117]|nr:Flp family type IVb pilin [Rhizorhapis sp. SPR117]
MIRMLRKLSGSDKGATAVEYGLICALIVLAAMGAIASLGTKTLAMWSNISNAVEDN